MEYLASMKVSIKYLFYLKYAHRVPFVNLNKLEFWIVLILSTVEDLLGWVLRAKLLKENLLKS